MKRMVFVVGHRSWGKSYTIRALLDECGTFGRRVEIAGEEFWTRMMSNDDYPEPFKSLMERVSRPSVIAALCPVFKDLKSGNPSAIDNILPALKAKGYQLYFWAMKDDFHGTQQLDPNEIKQLRRHGKVRLFVGAGLPASKRARALRQFIREEVLGK